MLPTEHQVPQRFGDSQHLVLKRRLFPSLDEYSLAPGHADEAVILAPLISLLGDLMMISIFLEISFGPVFSALLTMKPEIDADPWIMAVVLLVVIVIYNMSELRD